MHFNASMRHPYTNITYRANPSSRNDFSVFSIRAELDHTGADENLSAVKGLVARLISLKTTANFQSKREAEEKVCAPITTFPWDRWIRNDCFFTVIPKAKIKKRNKIKKGAKRKKISRLHSRFRFCFHRRNACVSWSWGQIIVDRSADTQSLIWFSVKLRR